MADELRGIQSQLLGDVVDHDGGHLFGVVQAARARGFACATAPSSTPTGLAFFPADTSVPVRHLAERTNNIVHWTELPRGGHFPGLETLALLLTNLQTFRRNVR
ncbi:hypothetical protein [Streptomyces sp. LBL]|uniref:hypothetical protein n=1 Tax=Streptomyces sp. LBL TaxID=2940562 RepID=UPI0024745C8F|nr:hypothetical protein [Streptomyces sp. LBL]